ncbi:MAG: response regulator transcription factor [Chitinophagales bacterium]|nr:response regulator transcription factor [Chitinophagales bacterium]HMV13724.1 response regulator transcription factor [Chitinophagales bacterium]HMW11897.1 response regulator transcription factor [Chitinophagales bacterium]HMX59523.1 response regulator transcription factor [Chitinophagales bacterium]HMY23133.1 response regulator transcription factor [Chitinophagales bacterium]
MEYISSDKQFMESKNQENRRFHLLIADKDKLGIDGTVKALKTENYKITEVVKSKELIAFIKKEKPDLVLLEVDLQEADGIEICWDLRADENLSKLPIVFISDRSDDFTQIAAFEAGADDFISKSSRSRLIGNKIKAILRRCYDKEEAPKEIKKFGNIEIDEEQVVIFKKGEPLKLSKKEFQLVLLLTSRPGKVFKRNYILLKVWGDDIIVGDRNIDTHIKKIRKKLGKQHIETVRGIGYKFIP